MTVERYVGNRWSGLSTDTLPTNVIIGSVFHETDTGTIYIYDGSTWAVGPQIGNLGDANISGLASGDFLSYNGTSWVNGPLVLADISDLADLAVADLDDTNITSPATDEVLAWDGTDWVNTDIATLISEINALTDLSDVTISAPADDELLAYNTGTGEWINQTKTEAGFGNSATLNITGVDTTVVSGTAGTAGNLLQWNSDGDAVDSTIASSNILTNSSSIGDLGDVVITTVADGEILQYNSVSGDWENTALTVSTDSTITGDGTGASPLSVNINDGGTATTELYSASYISSNYQNISEKNTANGYVGLDSNTKINSTYLPALSITEVEVVADITARDALTIGSGDGEIQEGDVAVVLDASADPDVPSGSASYIYDGTNWQIMGTPDIEAAGADTQIQYNNAGDFGASTNFTYDDSTSLLSLTGNFKLKENSLPSTPTDDEAVYFVETTTTETFVKVRLGNGDDAIVASYVQQL